jgi:hypothetical protein
LINPPHIFRDLSTKLHTKAVSLDASCPTALKAKDPKRAALFRARVIEKSWQTIRGWPTSRAGGLLEMSTTINAGMIPKFSMIRQTQTSVCAEVESFTD